MRYERHGPMRLDRFELETLGDRLRLALKRRGMTSSDLAREIHTDDANVSKYVTDEKIPGLENLIRMADALDVSIDWLLGRKEREV